jgi:5-formyltetrahydrofolate cyclo-ligase
VTGHAAPGPPNGRGGGRTTGDAGGDAGGDKAALRARLLAARRALPAGERGRRAAALAAGAVALAAGTGGPVCAYVPVGSEPGDPALVGDLLAAGHEVLLPVVAPAGPLDWARCTGPASLADAAHGLREPTGPRLGPSAIGRARLVLVPALAVDRRGGRLGKGRGHYDRSLPLAAPGTPLVAVVFDEELLDAVPVEPHDRPVTGALTPGGTGEFGNGAGT